jgi:hypothetical protein
MAAPFEGGHFGRARCWPCVWESLVVSDEVSRLFGLTRQPLAHRAQGHLVRKPSFDVSKVHHNPDPQQNPPRSFGNFEPDG